MEQMRKPADLDRVMIEELCFDFANRLREHDGMWGRQVEMRLETGQALRIIAEARERSRAIQIERLAKILGDGAAMETKSPGRPPDERGCRFEPRDLIPARLGQLPEETLRRLLEGIAVNWLAQDGVWFQAVEFTAGMDLAKKCNDASWAEFSPYEAARIRSLIGLCERPGLAGLKKALGYRLYAAINRQSLHDEGERSFVFRMDDCRVQAARRRKGLADYPCKSGGIVEYTTFARAVDPRIRTECVACPPDERPGDWFCAWRFVLE